MRFDDETREVFRKRLLARGGVLARELAELMGGKDKTRAIAALGLDKPGMTPEEILRAALAHVEKLRRWVVDGDDRYGRCHACDVDLGKDAMLEVPWADACRAHAGMV